MELGATIPGEVIMARGHEGGCRPIRCTRRGLPGGSARQVARVRHNPWSRRVYQRSILRPQWQWVFCLLERYPKSFVLVPSLHYVDVCQSRSTVNGIQALNQLSCDNHPFFKGLDPLPGTSMTGFYLPRAISSRHVP